jgi:SnoaL-like domain
MDDTSMIAALKRLWEQDPTTRDTSHGLYHDDAVLEFPQSQERFEGKANFMTWRKNYPASVEFKLRRIRGRGDFWVGELSIRYDGGAWNYGCSILEFRDDKIAKQTIYVNEGWEAPDWSTPWRAEWKDESLD